MKKNRFRLLILLMSISLMGIIFVQAYFLIKMFNDEEKRFEFNANQAIEYAVNTVENKETDLYFNKYKSLLASNRKPDSTNVSELFIYKKNNNTDETIFFSSGVLEESYTLTSELFDIGYDSTQIKRIISNTKAKVFSNRYLDDAGFSAELPELSFNNTTVLNNLQEKYFEDIIELETSRVPIYKRVTKQEIQDLISEKLNVYNPDIEFDFAIYANDLSTKVRTNDFEMDSESQFKQPIFDKNKYDANQGTAESKYMLYVNFPKRSKFLLSTILGMLVLAIVFTSILVFTYGSALYQLVHQRKISEIKTDFINNMTHEFKTPIATINLALDAIKSPIISENKEKKAQYLHMIREENKRMHAQVENVLRISKLEKRELNISKTNVNLHDVIEDAVSHIDLIVQDKSGTITTNLTANNTTILANETHLINVIVNILDNAVKYSPNAPEINVSTKSSSNSIELRVQDKGSGMSKAAQKRVFEKFYREHTGDIHNVKGHGLGLAYVKQIIDDHQGYITVESEKDKGSTFIIRFPLIP